MKNTALLMLAAILMLTLMAGCGGNNSSTRNGSAESPNAGTSAEDTQASDIKGKVTFYTNRTDMIGKQFVDYKKRFEEKYPGVTLQFEAVQDYEKASKIRISSGKYPDVMLVNQSIANSDLPKYFTPLGDIKLSGDIWFKDMKMVDGQMYGISAGGSTMGVVYNKKAYEKAGITEVPKTLDEFYAACLKLKEAGIVPVASNFKDKWPLGVWTDDVPTIIGGKSDHKNVRADTDAPFTMDGVYGQSWNIIRELYTKGYLEKDVNSTNWEQSKKDVAQGKFGSYVLGSWVINQIIENGAKSEDIGFYPFPADNSGQPKAPLNPDWFYAVNKNGNVAAAKAFVQWIVEDSGFDDFAGLIPTLKDKQAKLPQLAEFQSYKPQMIETIPANDKSTQILNKAQIDESAYEQGFILSKNPQSVFDKMNKAWANAKQAIG
ncbi:ABC-type glycerol-3-phosphate transport system, substrate-binding protein [Paenibacillus sp. UNC496MF]|uniref:ABC transporter substrate-binding protein n=1 Tax=Paenibacillus sp. UNC496MF TaxID=1502753 RepID=UPI0008E6AAB3|nr:ABC transporter substrate-binding protein [Paenibacillus sp. UNC496MF]SFJ76726.1 ABC-type glycerol-3-phosphate transport system, substrate-binding protein [Paenibacillus sp. UNC496MF]